MKAAIEEPEADVKGTRAERWANRRWYARPVIVIGAVTALAAGLRFYQLSTPHEFVFDEIYYAKDGCFDAGFDYRDCQLEAQGEQTVTVHPPLGRWIIAGGVVVFSEPADFHCPPTEKQHPSCQPFGYRVSSATAGTLSVLVVAILAYLLFGSVLWAGISGLLLATEGLNFVQSRMSMLDIFVATFVLTGSLFLVLDRRWIERRTLPPADPTAEEKEEAALLQLPPDRPPSPLFRPWRLGAGLAFGAAVATKWSGGTAVLAALILAVAWERTRRADLGFAGPLREAIRDDGFGILLFLLIVPIGVYVASYSGWFVDHHFSLEEWWRLQMSMARFSLGLRSPHSYASRPWTWIIMGRPVLYYYKCIPAAGSDCGKVASILGMGNPAIFWTALFALPYTMFSWIRKRDWRAGLITVTFLAQYTPWYFAARTSFFFYMAPITPFQVLAVAYLLKDLAEVRIGVERTRALSPVAGFIVLASVTIFVYFLPIQTGRVISHQAWMNRMWFNSWI